MDITPETSLRYLVDNLQACAVEELPTERANDKGILVEIHAEPDAMGFPRVTVSAYNEDALLDFIADNWGTEDAEWYRNAVVDGIRMMPTADLDEETLALLGLPTESIGVRQMREAREQAHDRPTSNLLGLIQRDLRGRLMFSEDTDGTRETVSLKLNDVRALLAAVEEIRDRLA